MREPRTDVMSSEETVPDGDRMMPQTKAQTAAEWLTSAIGCVRPAVHGTRCELNRAMSNTNTPTPGPTNPAPSGPAPQPNPSPMPNPAPHPNPGSNPSA